MKQNLVAGPGVRDRAAHRLRGSRTGSPPPEFLRLGGAALAGAAVPVLGTVGWTAYAGVGSTTLWYAVYGFRSDAIEAIATGSADGPLMRGLLLLGDRHRQRRRVRAGRRR